MPAERPFITPDVPHQTSSDRRSWVGRHPIATAVLAAAAALSVGSAVKCEYDGREQDDRAAKAREELLDANWRPGMEFTDSNARAAAVLPDGGVYRGTVTEPEMQAIRDRVLDEVLTRLSNRE